MNDQLQKVIFDRRCRFCKMPGRYCVAYVLRKFALIPYEQFKENYLRRLRRDHPHHIVSEGALRYDLRQDRIKRRNFAYYMSAIALGYRGRGVQRKHEFCLKFSIFQANPNRDCHLIPQRFITNADRIGNMKELAILKARLSYFDHFYDRLTDSLGMLLGTPMRNTSVFYDALNITADTDLSDLENSDEYIIIYSI
eukprot:TRINITY_DN446_c0_g2_i4.p1 TRINITY_DN446_c0_g2~~TRINITY_DN446_c0_g2_i4.p1  ORF type:complete len:196 (+),score=16.15 TRINITY_DN446_c0_g2_i4:267-854(+)